MRVLLLLLVFIAFFLIIPTYSQTNTVPTGTMPPSDWHLAPNSPYKNKGTDGKDPGANIDAVKRATCGVILGKPCGNAPSASGNPRVK